MTNRGAVLQWTAAMAVATLVALGAGRARAQDEGNDEDAIAGTETVMLSPTVAAAFYYPATSDQETRFGSRPWRPMERPSQPRWTLETLSWSMRARDGSSTGQTGLKSTSHCTILSTTACLSLRRTQPSSGSSTWCTRGLCSCGLQEKDSLTTWRVRPCTTAGGASGSSPKTRRLRPSRS